MSLCKNQIKKTLQKNKLFKKRYDKIVTTINHDEPSSNVKSDAFLHDSLSESSWLFPMISDKLLPTTFIKSYLSLLSALDKPFPIKFGKTIFFTFTTSDTACTFATIS